MSAAPPARPRLGLAPTALVAGLIGLVVSVVGLAIGIAPRHFTASEQEKIISWEVGTRWRTWPAGEIFPAGIAYQVPATNLASGTGLTLSARRLGIAPETSCTTVTDATAAGALARRGCTAMLRATYADATGALLVTVGVAVLPSARAATAVATALSGASRLWPGIRVAVIPRSLAAWFRDQDRQISMNISAGPYVVMYAAGFADGRPRAGSAGDTYGQSEMLSAAEAIADDIAAKIGAQPPPPVCPGAPGC
jgi:hypothetical protein